MGRKPFSVKVRQEALRLMMNGASAWDLVEKFGMSVETARVWKSEYANGNFEVEPVRRSYSKEIREKAYLLFEQGKGYKAVSSELALPMYTVRDWHRDFHINVFEPVPGARNKNLNDADKETVLRLAKNGHSVSEIMALTGLNFYPIRYLLRQNRSQDEIRRGYLQPLLCCHQKTPSYAGEFKKA